MNDAFGVRGIQSIRNVKRQWKKRFHIQRTPRDSAFQRHALQEFHHDERLPILLIDLINCADIWMVQSGGSLGFALEAAESLSVMSNFVGQKLEGHKAAELHILGLVDHAHTTTADFLDDAVVAQQFSGSMLQDLLFADHPRPPWTGDTWSFCSDRKSIQLSLRFVGQCCL